VLSSDDIGIFLSPTTNLVILFSLDILTFSIFITNNHIIRNSISNKSFEIIALLNINYNILNTSYLYWFRFIIGVSVGVDIKGVDTKRAGVGDIPLRS
jgi:hypothetical protein